MAKNCTNQFFCDKMMGMENFLEYTKQHNIEATPKMIEQLEKFLTLLLEWNEKFNLTGIKDPEAIWQKHFTDSASLVPLIPEKSVKLIDIGTGAGFPGIVVKILCPRIHLTLLESVGKKTLFLKEVVKVLELKNVEVIKDRAETLGHHANYRESFDVALSRAVAMLPTLLEYVMPFVKVDGVFIAQKKSGTEELDSSQNAIEVLGGKVIATTKVDSELLPERQIIEIQKIKETPKEYPRAEGMMKKRPL